MTETTGPTTNGADEAGRDLHPLERELLAFLAERGETGAFEADILAAGALPDEGSFRRAAQWILSRGLARESDLSSRTSVRLGPVGESSVEVGATPELALLEAVDEGRVSDLREMQDSDDRFDRARWGSALGSLIREGILRKGSGGNLERACPGPGVFGEVWKLVYTPLSTEGDEVFLEELPESVRDFVTSRSPRRGKGRAEFVLSEETTRRLTITPLGIELLEAAGAAGLVIGMLTPGKIASGEWRRARFRRYELDIPPARIHLGRLHPYRQFLDRVRRKFISMGFVEMTGPIAESEFWNNDALFMPQYHPARDIHDVYYLSPELKVDLPQDAVMDRVARVHEDGGETGGRGWGYTFSREQASRAILRSQGTSLSARCLASGPEIPGKYFAMARCFRYDQVDATHLPDFFQIEGIVLGPEINLRHLLGLLSLFAEEIAGAEEYRFLPAYFPFTEPSVEMHIRHPGLGWMEGGGAGLFRPEVCRPLGVEVPVIAWGLGLDRLAMLALGLDDIRDLITTDLSVLRTMRGRPDQMLSDSRQPEREGYRDAQDRG